MPGKVGRPKFEDGITHKVTCRFRESTMKKLEQYVEESGMTLCEVLRLSVERFLTQKNS